MSERKVDLVCGVVLLAFSVLLLFQLKGVPVEGVYFPQTVLVLLVICSLSLMVRAFLRTGGTLECFGDIPPRRWLAGTGIFVGQVLLATHVSFMLGMGCGMFAMLCLLMPRRTKRGILLNLVVSVAFLLVFRIFFTEVMHIFFPEPLLDSLLVEE